MWDKLKNDPDEEKQKKFAKGHMIKDPENSIWEVLGKSSENSNFQTLLLDQCETYKSPGTGSHVILQRQTHGDEKLYNFAAIGERKKFSLGMYSSMRS